MPLSVGGALAISAPSGSAASPPTIIVHSTRRRARVGRRSLLEFGLCTTHHSNPFVPQTLVPPKGGLKRRFRGTGTSQYVLRHKRRSTMLARNYLMITEWSRAGRSQGNEEVLDRPMS